MTDRSTARGAAADLVATLVAAPQPLRLHGTIEPYAWGGDDFLPRLAGLKPVAGQPAAELWLGAHPVAPAVASLEGHEARLDAVIAAGPGPVLGEEVAARFEGSLPYLLKVLDVRAMLSLQAHPTREQARAGFARENALGVPVDAPHRLYRDANHKPEMQVALGEFWMLHGFRPLVEVARDVARTPELGRLLPELISLDAATRWSSPREPVVRSALFARLMALPQDEVDRALAALLARLRPAYERGGLDKSSPDFWAARASQQFPLPGGRVDRGIVSIYLLNLVRLEAGDATFIPAGVLHAYLEGRNVELMAASDNVLRGGLTPKHVDVAELSRILTFEATTPARLVPQGSPGFSAFRAPVEEFALERWELPSGARTAARRDPGPTTLLVLEGRVTLSWGADAGRGAPTVQSGSPDLTHPSAARATARNATMTLERGGAVLVPASLRYQLHARADSVVFAATVPPRAAQNRS